MHGVLKELSKIFATLPGLGPRSARRMAITLALEKDGITTALIQLLQKMQKTIKQCVVCHNLSEEDTCYICADFNREQNQICIVADISDLWAIERIGQYNGVYHVLNAEPTLAFEAMNFNFESLEKRIANCAEHSECIIAMNPTIQGQATTHYIQEILKDYENLTISTLALGLPMGAQLDYLDNGTIAMAMSSRKELK